MIEKLNVGILAAAAGEFSSPESTLCAKLFSVPFHPCSIPVLLWRHVKDPGHSAKSARDRLHLNSIHPLTQQSWSGLTIPLSRHSVGIYPEMSSHTTHQGALGHSHLSPLSHCGLILA